MFLGGVAGGLARYAITAIWPEHGFPWALFAINIAGAFALCLLLAVLADVLLAPRYLRPLIGTGFLGAFTTFSSVVAQTDQMGVHGHAGTAILYLMGSLLAALAAAWSGLALGHALTARR